LRHKASAVILKEVDALIETFYANDRLMAHAVKTFAASNLRKEKLQADRFQNGIRKITLWQKT
jgi:hypothetical protein